MKKALKVAGLVFILLAVITISAMYWLESMWSCKPSDQGNTVTSIFVNQTSKVMLVPYKLDIGDYPSTEEGLSALMTPPAGKEEKWKGPYAIKIPLDPWGNQYVYKYPGTRNPEAYDISSLGPDGVLSDDDIQN